MNTVGPCAYLRSCGADDRELIPFAVNGRVTPIQCLHPELLAEIFTFCLSTNDTGINHAPLLLCNVCSLWRALVISTPLLWTNLNLRFNSLMASNMQSVVDGIHTWLGRSGILPLTIRLCCSESDSERCFDEVLDVCDALSTYASRWNNVDVEVPSTIFASWPNLRDVPLLRTLHVRSHFDQIPFTSAPCLARVHLFAAPSEVIPHIPWHQLVELAITVWLSDGTILQLITWCPLLDSIDVRISGFSNFVNGPVSIPPVEHAVLRNIKFCFMYDHYTIFESLVVPGLKSLSLCDDTKIEHRNWSREYSNPLGLMNRSHCELRELHFVRCCFNRHGLIEYLEHRSCRTLTTLRIENYGRTQNVFDELLFCLTCVDSKAEDSLCPELTRLTLTYCYPGNTSAGVLGSMILSCSRKTERTRLGSFELFIAASCELDETDQALLKRAEENGVKLCISNCIRWKCMWDE